MSPLSSLLRDQIAATGPITFAEYMRTALYHPEHGYYGAGRARIGREGDFFTNVSVGALFGTLLLRQFVEMWERLGCPAEFTIVEQGANCGDFGHDVLSAAERLAPDFYKQMRYVIAEPLPRLRELQQRRLAEYSLHVHWVADLVELAPVTGLFFSNELIDAFPVHVVQQVSTGHWMESFVSFENGNFHWTTGEAASKELNRAVQRLPSGLPVPYRTEIHLEAQMWVAQVAQVLNQGWLLAIDYGYEREEYYRPERSEGTLSAYRSHSRVNDLLASPGEIDLTAHVEFTSIIEEGIERGLSCESLIDQHHFMAGLAPLHFRDGQPLTPAYQKELRAFKTLMHPNLMGTSFKALFFSKNVPGAGKDLSGLRFGKNAS